MSDTLVEEYSGKSVMSNAMLPSPSQCRKTITENALADLKRQTVGQSWIWYDPPFEDAKQKALVEVEVKYANSGTEIDTCVLFTLHMLYKDGQGFVYGVNPGETEYGLSNGDQILSVNGMPVTGCDPKCVTELLKILVNKNKFFSLTIQRGSGSGAIFKLSLNPSESKWTRDEVPNGWDFTKNLDVVPNSFRQRDCFLMHDLTGLCVVSDGKEVRLETLHTESPSLTSAWHCLGKENDPHSMYYRSGRISVFGFKLKNSNSDSTKCLGVAHKDELVLVDADIPSHSIVLPTKMDCRYFYGTPVTTQHIVFESTIFEQHYLAVTEVKGEPVLVLKECTTKNGKPPQNAEIIFKFLHRNGMDSILLESFTSDNQWTSSPVIYDH